MSAVAEVMADELHAGRLALRVLTETDLTELHEIFSDPATHTIGEGAVSDPDWTRDWLRRRGERRRQHGVTWYGVRSPDGDLIGTAGLFFGRTGDEPELGFEIRAGLQGRGHGGAAAGAVVAEAHRAGFRRVWATVRPWNIASSRCLKRVGFAEDRTIPDERGGLIFFHHDSS